MSKQKPKLSEALQTSLSSIQEAWKDWENIPLSGPSANEKNKVISQKESLVVDNEPLFQQLKDQLESLS